MAAQQDRRELLDQLARDYEQALTGYLADSGERWLQQAYELGRRALVLDLGILDVVSIHGKASGAMPRGISAEFLSAALAPFEMTHRRYAESNAELMEVNVALQRQIEAYETEHSIAQVLQEAILEPPPRLEGLQIGVGYSSSTKQAQVGGDFYDVFEVTERQICAVIGDVSGKGIKAASLASMAKNTIRVHAVAGSSPGDILRLTNESLRRFTPPGLFVTILLAVIDAESGAVRFGSAGHPPGLVITADGEVRELDATGAAGPLVAAFTGVVFTDRTFTLAPGDVLFLYTDGAIEARCGGTMLGEQGFRDMLRVDKRVDPTDLVETAMKDLKDFCGGDLLDDVAMLAVRFDR